MRLDDLNTEEIITEGYDALSNTDVKILDKISYFADNLHGLMKTDKNKFNEHQWKNIKDLVNEFDRALRKAK